MIVLNTPHNPVGKVFTRDELERVAQLAEAHDLIVMSDEVVRRHVFHSQAIDDRLPRFLAPARMGSPCSMRAWCSMGANTFALRLCPECGSAQSPLVPQGVRPYSCFILWLATDFPRLLSHTELFAATGWRVGWLIGPPALIGPTSAATTRIVFCTNSPMQEASAAGFEQARERGFFETQLREYTERRAVLVDAFERLGLEYAWPEGSYFILLVSSRGVEEVQSLINA